MKLVPVPATFALFLALLIPISLCSSPSAAGICLVDDNGNCKRRLDTPTPGSVKPRLKQKVMAPVAFTSGQRRKSAPTMKVARPSTTTSQPKTGSVTPLDTPVVKSTTVEPVEATREERLLPVRPAMRRVALVLGNSAYKTVGTLANPKRDAVAIADMLKAARFDEVVLETDLSLSNLKRALREFSSRTTDADMAVVFFAGHAIEVGGKNYLIPTDAKLATNYDVEDETIILDRVMQVLEPVRRLKLVIIDACRDNPFAATMQRTAASRSIGRGLTRPEAYDSDVLVAYAAKAGSIAQDGDGAHSPFTTALLRHLTTPGLDIRVALGAVRDDVVSATQRAQQPFIYGSLGGGTLPLAAEK